ncbi:allantoicase [Kordiimonas laminariae]|uniref:allantoicase n=1 Tax=Kordiimonas laminariae TaxID=2917717 RepID=UPI001FF3B1F0|nr:allantoicase [Kordiimonas laminariae]MCK0070820.1 allantoicase [Kordiimonas laminariae]
MTDHSFTRFINMASPRLGAEVIFATDDFFADKSRLIKDEEAVFIPGKYDDNGKWMDGWESRRKRGQGFDHCILKLGQAGIIKGLDIDTSHFTGNFPPAASVEACFNKTDTPGEEAEWVEIVPSMNLNGDSHHLVAVENDTPFTHLRLNIYPDGGVARLRVYGEFYKVWQESDYGKEMDLLAMENGSRPIIANNEHFGVLSNIMQPGKGINMGDGWETRRRREPGNDWAIVALGHTGEINRILVDTAYFKGNFPESISLQAARVAGGTDDSLPVQSQFWEELMPRQKLTADAEHTFESELNKLGPISHVRINIYPDGGISRLRLFGTLDKD